MPILPFVQQISPTELAVRLAAGEELTLVDVREPWEWEIARIEGARLLPLSEFTTTSVELPTGAGIVVYCHHGVRSLAAAQFLAAQGVEGVANLSGGIDRYAREVDTTIPRY